MKLGPRTKNTHTHTSAKPVTCHHWTRRHQRRNIMENWKTFTLLWVANLPMYTIYRSRCTVGVLGLGGWSRNGGCLRRLTRERPFWLEQKWASFLSLKFSLNSMKILEVVIKRDIFLAQKRFIHNFLLEAVLKNLWRKFEKWDEVSSSTVKLGTPYVCMDPATYCWTEGDICQFWIFPCKRVCSQSSPMVEFLQTLESKITRSAPGWLPR